MANSIFQLFTITCQEQALHSETHETLLCPTTGQVEPMRLQLYAQHINSYGIFKRVPKQPVGRFFRVEDGKEIEATHWTNEMQKAYNTSVKGNTPVAGKGVSVTLYGKIVIITLLLALAFMIYKAYAWGNGQLASPVVDTIQQVDSLPSL